MRGFASLPRPEAADGSARRIGVEIEFGGLSEDRVARIVADTLGGAVSHGDGPFWTVTDSAIGKVEVYLDTALRKAHQTALRDLALRLGREVIPVELVTEPLDMGGMAHLQTVVEALRDAGAMGSGAGLAYGFGIHFNIQIASDDVADIRQPLLAYALIEDWLRDSMPIDDTRQVLPFTDPYPTSFVRDLINAGRVGLSDLVALYLDHCPSRNFGLDMLPIFAQIAPGLVRGDLGDATSARPTFHFRLPDCRIDEPEWGLPDEWARWVVVERVAQDEALLARLAAAWLDEHGVLTLSRSPWATRCGAILQKAGISA